MSRRNDSHEGWSVGPVEWLAKNGHDTAALTGQDTRAIRAIAWCWELYAVGDEAGQKAALQAVHNLLAGMQEKCWPLAKELIAFAMDWNDRDRLWPRVSP